MFKPIILLVLFLSLFAEIKSQVISDNFEGSGNISTWFGDNCSMDINFTNPYQTSINTSTKVLKYSDIGGQYANVRFDVIPNFNLATNSYFSLKIYIPSSGITGSQPNQISLKLQNNLLPAPWSTQCEIIKPLVLNQWQIVTFNFATDPYINLNPTSLNPIYRNDFNRVVLQINGENNYAHVLAYLDDIYHGSVSTTPVFNQLVWSDEFSTNGAIDSSKWFHQTQLPAGGNWYNGELQHYTNRLINSYVSSGNLNIAAKKEVYTNQGYTKQYTSARLNSKFAFQYGRLEVRAKLPTGVGTWPAIWMLGKNIIEPGAFWSSLFGTANWPACGEIDVMEHWGNNQNYVQSALHTPSSFGNTTNIGGQTISTASSQFHTYALEWTSEKMTFSVDSQVHYIYNPPIKNASNWPFNAPQYILLNIAIEPSITASFTQSNMQVDFVRVYQESPLPPPNTVNLTLFIEGYYTSNQTMRPVKINQENPNVSPADEVEDIVVELHNANYPYALVASSTAILKTNGTASCNFASTPAGLYYIVIKTKNAIETWSKLPQQIGATPLNYNFSSNANKAFGDNMIEIEPNTWALFSGDIIKDENIDLLDLLFLEFDINSFQFGIQDTDMNGDGNVDLLDGSSLENNINSFIFSNHP